MNQRSIDFDKIIEEGRANGWSGQQCFEKYKVLHPDYCVEEKLPVKHELKEETETYEDLVKFAKRLGINDCSLTEETKNKPVKTLSVEDIRAYRRTYLTSSEIKMLDEERKDLTFEALENHFFGNK